MKKINYYHHFKGTNLSPSEKVQRYVIALLIESKVPDSARDSSIVFEIKHSSEVIQVGRILAQKRKLNITLVEVIAALHDIEVIVNGSYKEHAKRGSGIAKKILKKIGGFSEKEINLVCNAIAHHSEKEIYSNNPYTEIIKDADVFDCSLFEKSEDGYRLGKTPLVFHETTQRIKKVRQELGLPPLPIYRK